MEQTRDHAWQLTMENISSESLRRHCLAGEAAMRHYARHFGQDEEMGGIAGLLHDLDYEKFPDKHPWQGVELLRSMDYPPEVIQAILGHASFTNTPRESLMAKCLFAVDELAGFVVACSRVHPEGIAGLESKSVLKKLKRKDFAANVSRQEIDKGAEELGVAKENHIKMIIEALRADVKTLSN